MKPLTVLRIKPGSLLHYHDTHEFNRLVNTASFCCSLNVFTRLNTTVSCINEFHLFDWSIDNPRALVFPVTSLGRCVNFHFLVVKRFHSSIIDIISKHINDQDMTFDLKYDGDKNQTKLVS